VSILTQIARRRVATIVPVVTVEVDEIFALADAVGVLTQRTTTTTTTPPAQAA
jgi:ABC-type nitrate/sulfonate/bicarbonate transport system ATPase subunit